MGTGLDPHFTLASVGMPSVGANALRNAGVETVGDLLAYAATERAAGRSFRSRLLRIPNFGLRSVREAERIVALASRITPTADAPTQSEDLSELRDRIAIAAMTSIISCAMKPSERDAFGTPVGFEYRHGTDAQDVAYEAYFLADAMLAARKAPSDFP